MMCAVLCCGWAVFHGLGWAGLLGWVAVSGMPGVSSTGGGRLSGGLKWWGDFGVSNRPPNSFCQLVLGHGCVNAVYRQVCPRQFDLAPLPPPCTCLV